VKVDRFTLTLLRVDGTDAGLYTSTEDQAVIGRETGGIFASDATLSPLHAKFERRGDRLFVSDASSLNGVYRRLVRNVPAGLEPGDGFRIGQEVMRYELLGDGDSASDVQTLGSPRRGIRSRIVSVVGRGDYGNASSVPPTGLLLGRERGDVLFPEDGYVSGLHCRIHLDGTRAFITDLGSSNGTFLRLRSETEVGANDVLLMGQQLFRVGIP
jgi:predicted component of type VI protein secretion system